MNISEDDFDDYEVDSMFRFLGWWVIGVTVVGAGILVAAGLIINALVLAAMEVFRG